MRLAIPDKWQLILLAALGLVLGCVPSPLRAAEAEARVLMLYGLDPYIPTFLAMDQALREDLARNGTKRTQVFAEALDSQRFPLDTLEPDLAALLATKYRALQIDVVVAVSRTALDFYQRHGAQLWPGSRLVYVGFLGYEFKPAALPEGASSVLSILDVAGTIDIARKMQPDARRIVVVSGSSEIDTRTQQQARDAFEERPAKVPVDYIAGATLAEILARLAKEPSSSIVIYLTQFRDREGTPYEPFEVLRAVIAGSPAPVYGAAEPFVGLGIVAGSVSSYESKGRLIGEQVRRAIAGQQPDASHRMLQAPNRCVADSRALRRWSLDKKRLPEDCEIRFEEVPVWRQYWQEIFVTLGVVAAQAALIVALIYQRRRRVMAERAEQAQRAELAHVGRLAVAGELTGAIAHEINQPLGAILSNADAGDLLLDSGTDQRDKLRAILADIRRDDLRASEVIRRLRELLGKHHFEQETFDLNQVVAELEAIIRAEAKRRGVRLEFKREPDALPVIGDRIQVQQVLLNLVLNAMDAVQDQSDDRREVSVATTKSKRRAVLAVRDRGPGIPPQNLPLVFDSFFSTKTEGMGLGLSISRTIVEAHGGRLSVDKTGSEGTTFRAELPLANHKAGLQSSPT